MTQNNKLQLTFHKCHVTRILFLSFVRNVIIFFCYRITNFYQHFRCSQVLKSKQSLTIAARWLTVLLRHYQTPHQCPAFPLLQTGCGLLCDLQVFCRRTNRQPCRPQQRNQPKKIGGPKEFWRAKMFDFRRITLFCLGSRLR